MRKTFRLLTASLVTVLATFLFSTESAAVIASEENLIMLLSKCVDHNNVVVNKECLQRSFFPRLGLSQQDKILRGMFGINTDGRFFSITVSKISRSGATNGLFEIGFYLERHKATTDGAFCAIFEARGGNFFGTPPLDHLGLISIYDLSLGDTLVNDAQGRVINGLHLEPGKMWSAEHSARNLLNSGKTIGYVLTEHLENMEQSGKGGFVYTNSAENRYHGSRDYNKYRLTVPF